MQKWIFVAGGVAVAGAAAFFVFKFAFRMATSRSQSTGGNSGPDPALLVLRVFTLGKRSELLFAALTRRWRPIGNDTLNAGVALAVSPGAPRRS